MFKHYYATIKNLLLINKNSIKFSAQYPRNALFLNPTLYIS